MLYIRNLNVNDDFNQYMKCVEDLNGASADVCNVEEMRRNFITRPNNIVTYVITIDDKIVSTASVIFEKKLRYKRLCCHIEDVGVDRDYRKKGYGKMIVEHCILIAKTKDCYKVKLNCSDKNVKFYEKLGFICSSNGMEKVLTKIV